METTIRTNYWKTFGTEVDTFCAYELLELTFLEVLFVNSI